jgi:hypothetical protein
MTEQPQQKRKHDIDVMPWYICAGDDGLKKDCIMVAVMNGAEIDSISLHLAGKPELE